MSIENGIITSPVSVFDVRSVLGISSTDVGTLCKSKKINKWSRYKPVHIANKIEVDRSTLWYRGTHNTCGLDIPSTTSRLNIVSYYNSNLSEWTYEPPSGGASSPYRLLDFLKYKHDALPAIAGFSCPGQVKQDGTFTCSVLRNNVPNDESEFLNAGSLGLEDIYVGLKTLGEFYFGCVVTDTSYNVKFFAAGRKKSDGTYSTDFPNFSANTLTLGSTYFVYPFLAQNPQDQSGNIVANNYLTLPSVNKKEIKVVSAEEFNKLEIQLIAKYIYDPDAQDYTKIEVTYKISNKGTQNLYLSNNSLRLRYSSSTDADNLSGGEQSHSIGNISVIGGASISNAYTFNIGAAYRDKSYKIILTLQSGTYRQEVWPIKPLPPSQE